jgi:hypothetical protein
MAKASHRTAQREILGFIKLRSKAILMAKLGSVAFAS